MLHTKNYQNQPMFHRVVGKIKVARFLLRHGAFKLTCRKPQMESVLIGHKVHNVQGSSQKFLVLTY